MSEGVMQTTAGAATTMGLPILIRYDGLDADAHRVEIGDLATSLKGFSRILTVAATFAVNQRLVERSKARPVRVLVGPPRDGCVVVEAALTWLDQHQFIGGTVSGLTVSLVGYIFNRAAGQKEEMRHLATALETAIRELGHRDDTVVRGLLDTVNRMADILKPAARQAVVPVGRSAGTITVGEQGATSPGIVIDQATRDAIDATNPPQIGTEVDIAFMFTEMNHDSRTCRVSVIPDDGTRTPAEITDPEFLLPNNPYAGAFAAKTSLVVRAKPTLRDEQVERWYISGHD